MLLDVRDLTVAVGGPDGPALVTGVSFALPPGTVLGLVGESGCGKTMTARALPGLLPEGVEVTGGSVWFAGRDLAGLPDKELRAIRGREIAVISQEPMVALDPMFSVGYQLTQPIRRFRGVGRAEARRIAAELLGQVGIVDAGRMLRSYPHQLSGGMRQRAMIAMALLFTPDLVIMDEPTSALDVVAQRSLMVQIKELQAELGFSVIFVTHDMSLVRHFSDRLMVMYAGQVAEFGATSRVFGAPQHPYTVGLMDAFPSIRGARVPLTGIPGQPPDLARLPEGCLFAQRCPKVMTACKTTRPPLYLVEGTEVRCLLYSDGSAP
jgi:oligopeptide/dipeptide ABC transporter ATP-binding protein